MSQVTLGTRPWWAEGQFAEAEPTTFQKVLLTTDGTVTELLSLYTRRGISARRIDQSLGVQTPPPEMCCAPGEQLLHRRIVLSPVGGGGDSVFAESHFVFSLFSPSTQRALLQSDVPIGLLWRADRLEMFREVLERKIELNADVAKHLGVAASTRIFSRTYSISCGGRVLGLICEKFAETAYR